jgi:hypothetical protein
VTCFCVDKAPKRALHRLRHAAAPPTHLRTEIFEVGTAFRARRVTAGRVKSYGWNVNGPACSPKRARRHIQPVCDLRRDRHGGLRKTHYMYSYHSILAAGNLPGDSHECLVIYHSNANTKMAMDASDGHALVRINCGEFTVVSYCEPPMITGGRGRDYRIQRCASAASGADVLHHRVSQTDLWFASTRDCAQGAERMWDRKRSAVVGRDVALLMPSPVRVTASPACETRDANPICHGCKYAHAMDTTGVHR